VIPGDLCSSWYVPRTGRFSCNLGSVIEAEWLRYLKLSARCVSRPLQAWIPAFAGMTVVAQQSEEGTLSAEQLATLALRWRVAANTLERLSSVLARFTPPDSTEGQPRKKQKIKRTPRT